ncbi:MAG: hypothetical protein Kow0037_15200 [Calditrichia bacterium]
MRGLKVKGEKNLRPVWVKIFGLLLLLAGSVAAQLNPEFLVNTNTSNTQEYPAVAMNAAGNFVVVWQSWGQDGSRNGIYAQRYGADGTPLGGEFRVNTYTTDYQGSPSVAMDASGNFVVVWESWGQDGSSYGIYAQRYAAGGSPQGGEFRVNTYTTDYQSSPSVAMNPSGNFVVVWQSKGQDGSEYGIYAQRYAADGSPLGGEFRVNTYTTDSQSSPSVAMDGSGNFVVVWNSNGQDGSGYGIYAQRYGADGSPLGGEFRVNTYTTDSQSSPSVAMDGSGNFVVVWQSYEQDGSGYGIYAQRYAADGSPLGGEFRVNTYTNDYQQFPSVAMDAAGNFVVEWESNGQDGSGYGIYAQRYGADGSPLFSEFRVNTYTSDPQKNPSVAMDGSGNFVVAWQSFEQDASSYGIYGKLNYFGGVPLMNPEKVFNIPVSQLYSITLNHAECTIDSANLYHKLYEETEFHRTGFFSQNDSVLYAEIPAVPVNKTIEYYLELHYPSGSKIFKQYGTGKPFVYSVTPELNTITIAGRVFLKGENNHAGVKIVFEPLTPAGVRDSTVSDSLGRFVIPNLKSGYYVVRYQKSGYLPHTTLALELTGNGYLDDVQLAPGNIHYISGNVKGRFAAGDMFLVTGPITVAAGDSLVIEQGAKILFLGKYDLVVNGYLSAEGAEGDPVYFGSGLPDPSPGDWRRIVMSNMTSGSGFRHCIIEHFDGFTINGGSDKQIFFIDCEIESNDSDTDATFKFQYFYGHLTFNQNVIKSKNYTFNRFYGTGNISKSNLGNIKDCLNMNFTECKIGRIEASNYSYCTGFVIIDSEIEECNDLINSRIVNCKIKGPLYKCKNLDIDQTYIISRTSTAIYYSDDIYIENSIIYSNSVVSKTYYGSGADFVFNKCTFMGSGTAVQNISDGSFVKISNCIFEGFSTGISFQSGVTYEISHNNFSNCNMVASGAPPAGLGNFHITNPVTGYQVDDYGNMKETEVFASTNPDDSTFLHLTAASPSIDAGDPDSLDADGTIADLGAYYFDQTAWVPGFPRTENLPDGRLKLRWQTPLADTLQQYQIAYRVLGHALYQDTLFTADTTLIPDGLADNTTYQFQLRSVFPNSLSRPTWAVGTPGTAVANLAQSIWNFELAAGENVVDSLVVSNPGSRTLNLTLINPPPEIEFLSAVTSVGPGQTAAFPFRYTAPAVNNQYTYVFGLITEQTTSIDTLSLLVNANVGYSNQGVLSHFTPVDSTGLPYTVILSNAELDGSALEIGDEIGLFDGDLCVGARVFNGIFNFSLTAWRKDDGMGLPGFTPGHPIEVRVWDRSRSIEAEMDETFQVGDGTFGYGQYSVLAVSGSVYRPQRINLANNMFELISFNRLPKNPAAPAIFDSIPGLKIVYDSDGRIYIPEYHLNSIGNIDILKGYYLYFAADSSFELAVPGISLDPQNFSYTIRAHRFNNISYLPEDTMGVVSAFGAIMDSIAIIQDSKGRSFIPEYPNAATLTYLEPGRGYQLALKSQSDVSFTYPAVSGQMEKEFVPVVMAPPEHFIAKSSGKPYSIIVRSVTVGGEKLEAGDEIGVFDGELLVGGARYTGNLPLTVTAWESDSLLRIPGFRAGNPICFKIYKHRLGVETDAGVSFARGNQQLFKGDFYSVADISVEKLVPLQFQLHQNYPNPFNPETRIRFDLPTEERVQLEIYNVLGQRVKTLVSGRVSAGYHEVVWNGRNQQGRPVGSGIYVYRIQAGDHHAVKKMVFLK